MNTQQGNKNDPIRNKYPVKLEAGPVCLNGYLEIPSGAQYLVIFIRGCNFLWSLNLGDRYLAKLLNKFGIATLRVHLLTPEEDWINQRASQLRFDSCLLAYRLEGLTNCLRETPCFQGFDIGCLGIGTGSAIALIAAADCSINAIVSLEGRPDLAGLALSCTHTPTMLIVGENNPDLIVINQETLTHFSGEKCLKLIPGAAQLLLEPRSLEQAADFSSQWFQRNRSPTLMA